MPRRTKLPKAPSLEGMGGNADNAEIQKARPLQSLAETDLTLPEFKILDAYLARINSHDSEKRTVVLEKGELERTLGVTRILKDDLNKRLRHLFQVIEVKDAKKQKGFKLINLFEEADAEQDDDGLWQITLTCTPSAREYIFNIDNIGYLRYRLKNVVNLTSRYSYVLFLYLLDNRFRKTWSIELEALKSLLNCTADTYKQYYRFNDLILKKCHKELCEKTDIQFTYEPIKRGRGISAIEFTVQTVSDELASIEEPLLPLSFLNESETGSDRHSENISFLSGACSNEFSYENMELIFTMISTMDLPEHSEGINFARYHYLAEKYAILNIESKKRNIRNRFSYFKAIIENDRKTGEGH